MAKPDFSPLDAAVTAYKAAAANLADLSEQIATATVELEKLKTALNSAADAMKQARVDLANASPEPPTG